MTTFADSPSTFVWVAKNGNDTKARRGRIDLPFLTIQAALTAALAGDTLAVAVSVGVTARTGAGFTANLVGVGTAGDFVVTRAA